MVIIRFCPASSYLVEEWWYMVKWTFAYFVVVLFTKLCPTLWDPTDCSPPGSSVHRIFQARRLKWVAISFSRGSFQTRDRTYVSCIGRRFFTAEPPGKPSSLSFDKSSLGSCKTSVRMRLNLTRLRPHRGWASRVSSLCCCEGYVLQSECQASSHPGPWTAVICDAICNACVLFKL